MNKILITSVAAAMLFAGSTGVASANYPAPWFLGGGDIVVSNSNGADIDSDVDVSADTGDNDANGGDAGRGSRGGDAFGWGVNTGGNGGDGGNGAFGGAIVTGEAIGTSHISNDVNRNDTNIVVEDCGCEGNYNETLSTRTNVSVDGAIDYRESGDASYNSEEGASQSEQHNNTASDSQNSQVGNSASDSHSAASDSTTDASQGGSVDEFGYGGSSSWYDNFWNTEAASDSAEASNEAHSNQAATNDSQNKGKSESEWHDDEASSVHLDISESSRSSASGSEDMTYTKTYVPTYQAGVMVTNSNGASVDSDVDVDADSGDNDANGGNGDDAGRGGDAGNDSWLRFFRGNASDNEGGNGGDGGNGAGAGVITSGYADSLSSVANTVNQNVTRVRR